MSALRQRAAALLSVKSVVTIASTAVFAVLSLRGSISSKDFLSIFIMIIGFYFGTQSRKGEQETAGDAP